MKKHLLYLSVVVSLVLAMFPAAVFASADAAPSAQGPWWEVTPEPEVPSSFYDSILYSEIAPKLREIELNSNRVRVEVIGQSAGGRNLFLATISSPEAMGRLGQYQAIRQQMLKDPEKAQEMIDKFGDFKVPVFINGSIHGNEYPGTDAAMRLIEKLAYDDSPEVQQILDNVILLVNVVQNPDGRVLGTRGNANGFDVNRDFITQSQPETRATVKVLTEWNPMVFLDLHGFVNPMLIEPCTPPHNPNYEYDLYIKWALAQAEAMEAELMAQTEFTAQIPFRDDAEGWDDWPPIFAPMYSMYHGAYGHTLETPSRDARGVDAHYAAVWGALRFISQNREAMVRDQVEIFKRGFLDLPQVAIPDEILAQTPYEQYNEMTTIDFPTAYVIPAVAPLQQSPYEAARVVDFLLRNDVQVERAVNAFEFDGVTYPAGSYVVWMNQPKRGLANTVLWAGWDISYDPGLTMYDISGWSHPLLWGFTRAIAEGDFAAKTTAINRADLVVGKVENGKAKAYAYLPTDNMTVKATNELLAQGYVVYRMETAFTDNGRTFGPGTFIIAPDKALANQLANGAGLDLYALSAIPTDAIPMHRQKIAVFASEGVRFFLNQYGFDATVVSTTDLNNDLLNTGGYEVFVNSSRSWGGLSAAGRASVQAFAAAGGDVVGIGRTGVPFVKDAGLMGFTFAQSTSRDNGVVAVNYSQGDPAAAGYPAASHGFVYGPVWFTVWEPAALVGASYAPGAFFVSGYWPNWDTGGAAGMPALLHKSNGASEVTAMGLDPTFRAHPEHTFRLLSNAIYNGMN
jgi:hypothetical protein